MEPLGAQSSVFHMVLSSGPVVQSVLVLLIGLSVWSWAITIAKILQFRRARLDTDSFSHLFRETRNLARVDDSTRRFAGSPLTQVFAAGYRELTHLLHDSETARSKVLALDEELDAIQRALKRAEYDEFLKLERGNTFLATVASAAPFIGLFGTVWGIMNAFHGLGSLKSSTLQAVAPGISEALVATAIGLAAAIPAAIAYNYFSMGVKQFREQMDKFSADFVSLARRYFSPSPRA